MSFRSFLWVTPDAVVTVASEDQIPAELGEKARGLLRVPAAWVPTYLVLSPEFLIRWKAAPAEARSALVQGWTPQLAEALHASGLDSAKRLYLRSNALRETIESRGLYQSQAYDREGWPQCLGDYFGSLRPVDEPLGVIVQRFVKPVTSGHLSNERRVVEEYRDGVVESIDEATGEETLTAVSLRRWRRSAGPTTDALACTRSGDVVTALREPLAFAALARERLHIEWVWDGSFVHIVQADLAPERETGVSPRSVVAPFVATPSADELLAFRVAHESDEARSGKLKNHVLYEALGYRQPPFYILDDRKVFEALLHGAVGERLARDLEVLTARPLIIRTSSTDKTMLPRSDQLYDAQQAGKWLLEVLCPEILRRNLDVAGLSLLAHHFIPALAAAFSTASPDAREVYVEALWGIPDGLYYYACDAYLVDTGSIDVPTGRDRSRFSVRKDLSYKGEFVAPDSNGRFVLHSTERPWDWKSTIDDDDTLAEIAALTRTLVRREGSRVNVMWFVGCEAWTGLPSLLPWYHGKETDDSSSLHGEYRRNARDERLDLRTEAALLELEARANRREPSGQRLVLRLNPAEDRILRNHEFAERVAAAAVKLSAVVELEGSILSHAYYVLKRSGANVAIRRGNRFRQAPETFQKLVRDRIPEVVAAGGEEVRVSHLSREQLRAALKIKLVEEAFEVRDAAAEGLMGELADVLEVVQALADAAEIDPSEIERLRREKRRKRGGFDDGVVLIETLVRRPEPSVSAQGNLLSDDDRTARANVVDVGQPPPLEDARAYTFDVRRGEGFVEMVQTWLVGLTFPEWRLVAPSRVRLDSRSASEDLDWTLEGKREGLQLKLRLKIRVGSQQLLLPFVVRDEASDAP